MLPSAVLTQPPLRLRSRSERRHGRRRVKGTHLAACGPLPVTIGKWVQPACSTAVQQLKPSLTTLLPAAKSRLASTSISFLRKPLTTVRRSRLGLRSAVVSTAATNGVVPAAPRPRLPPERAPPEIGVVDLDPAGELGLCGLARFHRRHQLVLEQPGGRLPCAQPAGQLDRRHPALALGQVVDRQEPRRQRQFGPVEHRPGGQPDLVLAAVALPDGTAGERSTAAMAAGRADPALAPSAAARLIRLRRSGGPRAAEGEREQRRAALRLGPEPGAEPRLAQPLDPPPQPTLAAHPTASRTPRTRANPSKTAGECHG